MSNNYSENYEGLINEAGNTIFENIYKNCQNEIKDQIITKLLSKIEQQNKKIDLLEKENKKIKDNFTYVLKRILSSRDEYNIKNKQNNAYVYSNDRNKSNKAKNNPSYTIRRNFNKENYIKNYYSKKEFSNIDSSIDNRSIEDSIDEAQNNDILEAKAKRYLNDLYRNNFGGTDGTPYSNFINKNISIYEELFPKSINNNSILSEIGDRYESPYKRNTNKKISKRNISTEVRRKKIHIEDFENKINHKQNKDIVTYTERLNSSIDRKSRNNNESEPYTDRLNRSVDKKNKNRYNNLLNYRFKKNDYNGYYTESNKKNKKNNISFEKRSPYLLNKV